MIFTVWQGFRDDDDEDDGGRARARGKYAARNARKRFGSLSS